MLFKFFHAFYEGLLLVGRDSNLPTDCNRSLSFFVPTNHFCPLPVFSCVHPTLQPAWSVGQSVGRSHFTFFYDFFSLTSLLLPTWCGDLKYGQPARDFGSRVSGLVFKNAWGRFVYEKDSGAECHGNDRIQL